MISDNLSFINMVNDKNLTEYINNNTITFYVCPKCGSTHIVRNGHYNRKIAHLDDEDNYVGIFNLSHELNDFLRNGPGHIGYGISKKYRHKGYATKGLALCLKKAKEKGIDIAYLSAHKDNYPSIKAQLNNGAYIDHEDDKEVYTRIKL